MKKFVPFYDPKITRAGKKYSVYVDGPSGRPKLIHFGDRSMQHYKDRTSQRKWARLDHLDPVRRRSYLARAKGIRNRKGLAWKDRNSPNYYAVKYLW